MDYKYIEQLLDKYWSSETTLKEEQILRTFFTQENVPTYLLPYKDIFMYQQKNIADDILSNDFDKRILEKINEDIPVKAHKITIYQRLMPLFKAAAIIAIILTLQNVVQTAVSDKQASTQQISNIEKINKVKKGTSFNTNKK